MMSSTFTLTHDSYMSIRVYKKLSSKYCLSLIEASLDPLVTINIGGKITDMNQFITDLKTLVISVCKAFTSFWLAQQTKATRASEPPSCCARI